MSGLVPLLQRMVEVVPSLTP